MSKPEEPNRPIEDKEFERTYQRELDRYPAIFHIVGEKKVWAQRFAVVFNVIYALITILIHYDTPVLLFSKLGVLIVTAPALVFLIDRGKYLEFWFVVLATSIILAVQAPLFLVFLFFLNTIWAITCYIVKTDSFKKAQDKAQELYKLELEHDIHKHREIQRDFRAESVEKVRKLRFCPQCGFSLADTDEKCVRCNIEVPYEDEEEGITGEDI